MILHVDWFNPTKSDYFNHVLEVAIGLLGRGTPICKSDVGVAFCTAQYFLLNPVFFSYPTLTLLQLILNSLHHNMQLQTDCLMINFLAC